MSTSETSLFDQIDREPVHEAPPEAPSVETLSPEAIAQNNRKRLAEQLDALKRKEFELRRALAAAEHPELADAIRSIELGALAVSRATDKLAQGFSKSEARRREVVDKKLAALRAKREELDAQIGALETELAGLGSDRLAGFESERRAALEQLLIALGSHHDALTAAGLEPSRLVPEIEGWLPELDALAEKVSARASA
jgi:chromosome segregation ATPase